MPCASCYVRLSDAADAANLSRDGMLADQEALAERHGFTIIGRHVDDGISGAVRDRPGFLAWLDDARSGRADVLLTWHADRLTREGVNVAALILDTVEGKDSTTGAVVRSPVRLMDAHGLDSADGDSFRWRFVIAAEVARAERERMRARNLAAQRRLRAAGRHHGGTAPYGTRVVDGPEGGRFLELEPTEAAALRECASRLLAGDTLPAVARWMTEHGFPPRRASSWSRVTVRQALTSEAAGRLIFSPSERLALREALAVRRPDARKGGRKPSRLLSGLLVCSGCGTRLQVARYVEPVERVSYRCPTRGSGGTCPSSVVVSALPVEAYVSEAFLASSAADLALLDSVAEVTGSDRLASVLDRLAEVWEAMPAADRATRAALLAEADSLETLRDELEAEPVRVVRFTVPTGRTLGDVWSEATDDAARRAVLLDALEGPIVVSPGRRGPRTFDPARVAGSLSFVGDAPEPWE